MKNEIVTPAGADGEGGAARRRRFSGFAVRIAVAGALAGLGAAAVQAATAAQPAACDVALTRLIVPALRQTAFDRRTIRAEPAELTGQPDGVHGVRLFVVPDHPGTPNRDATIGWATLDTRSMRALDITRDADRPDVLTVDRHAMSRVVSACFASAAPAPAPAAGDCDALNRRAQQQRVFVTGSAAGRVVVGRGRLPLYSAPDAACPIRGLFVVEHDHVDAYAEYGRYTSVIYLNPRTRATAEGWVATARLKPDGTGIAPRQP
ncbi:hypothetical protein [Burkholderia metallica]|uniref:hypothetical protein n=1 Tax=Burkholderia metallica TaxID=488729 RepID=UPI001F5B4895|nr:hypothetical protein [Burkholderia metallica]